MNLEPKALGTVDLKALNSNARKMMFPKEEDKWEKGEKILVYFDIMGFRAKMSKTTHENLFEKITRLHEDWEKKSKPYGDVKIIQFSDTLIAVVNGVGKDCLNRITKASIRIIQCALKSGFAIKGVMAQGEFSINEKKQIYFGRPLVDAYELFDDVHFYGVLVHDTAEGTVKKYASEKIPYLEGIVPLKKSRPNHCYLGWWMLDEKLYAKKNVKAQEWIDHLEESASGNTRMYMLNTRELIKNEENKILNVSVKQQKTKSRTKKKKPQALTPEHDPRNVVNVVPIPPINPEEKNKQN